MIYLNLKQWNKQWSNPKVEKLIIQRIKRMIEVHRATLMIDTEKCDCPTELVDRIQSQFPEDKIKCQGPLSKTNFYRFKYMEIKTEEDLNKALNRIYELNRKADLDGEFSYKDLGERESLIKEVNRFQGRSPYEEIFFGLEE